MKRVFVMTYSSRAGSPASVERWADASPLVEHWRYDLPNCIYLLSESTAVELAESFAAASNQSGGFVIVEASGQLAGLMTQETWDLLSAKKALAAGRPDPARQPAVA